MKYTGGEIFPSIYLVQAGRIKKDNNFYIAQNGIKMMEGCYGLTISNDPFIVFSKQPLECNDSIFDLSIKEDFDTLKHLDVFDKELIGYVYDMNKLYNSCISEGWDQQVILGHWISDRIAKFVKSNKPLDIFPMI